ncbi:MAG: hypothetical protein M1594_01980 [Candidatus Marsarchaeota archaeon]|nr:hypothetical protein [Candidatus Marsarchaeota archaeon]
MMRKGQSALEYLVTYGWAILAIVIVAAILWYFGVFNPSRFTSSHQCGGFSDFQCLDYAVNAGGNTTIVLGNKLGTQINVTTIEIGNSTANCSIVSASDISANGQVTGTCLSNTMPAANAGNTYNVNVTFTDMTSGLTHSDSGFIGSS